jgi:hypothetical protein
MALRRAARLALAAGDDASRRLPTTGPLALARMGGSSIASPGAAGWVTDFLNAAYYARPRARRDVEDMRLAACVLTTCWHRWGRRLRLGDLGRFHRAFGRARMRGGATLEHEQVLEGAGDLVDQDFAAGWANPERRAHGIVFRDAAARAAFDPALRLRDGALGELTPPLSDPAAQDWHTYKPVPLPSAERAAAVLATPERWPELASELGRFTAVRRSRSSWPRA